MSKKYYFDNQDENCYSLDYWRDYMTENGIKKLEVFEAKRETGTGYFFCKEAGEIGETGECGKQCNDYKPAIENQEYVRTTDMFMKLRINQ